MDDPQVLNATPEIPVQAARDLAADFNGWSLEHRDDFASQAFLDLETLRRIIRWGLDRLPNEILVGIDYGDREVPPETLEATRSANQKQGLFGGFGRIMDAPELVNEGSEESVQHVPSEWLIHRKRAWDNFLHTHPNAPAMPSRADANAVQSSYGIDMILGLWFKGERQSGYQIEGIELSGYNRGGYGINVIVVDFHGFVVH